jgi:hypothetical protein
MSTFPIGIPIPVPTGSVSIDTNIATYQLTQGIVQFDVRQNPVRILDGELRQALMRSLDGGWYLETNSGGVSILGVRLFHQTYLTKLPAGHEFIPPELR